MKVRIVAGRGVSFNPVMRAFAGKVWTAASMDRRASSPAVPARKRQRGCVGGSPRRITDFAAECVTAPAGDAALFRRRIALRIRRFLFGSRPAAFLVTFSRLCEQLLFV